MIDNVQIESRLLLIDAKSSSSIPMVRKGLYGTKMAQIEPLGFDSNFPKKLKSSSKVLNLNDRFLDG